MVGGQTYLAAFAEGAEEATRSFALAYCQQRDAKFGGVGMVRGGALPAALAPDHAAALQTYSPASRQTCSGADCPFVAVIECVPEGLQACPVDEAGNVG